MGLFTSNTKSDNQGNETFYFHTSNRALIIFTRNPKIGMVKTRLAKETGDEVALKIYNFLLQHTVKITKDLKVDKYVYYSDSIGEYDIWDDTIYRKRLQSGEDLGKRMKLAFHDLFTEGYEEVIILGTDMFDLDQRDIEIAFEAFSNVDFVIGPAEDGGYYLLGMKKLYSPLFEDKNWGTHTVLNDTLKDLENQSLKILPEKNDVDYLKDIEHIAAFQPFLETIKNR